MKRYILPLALSQVADVLSTGLSLSQGGFETNPIAKFLIDSGGLPLLVMTKLLIVLFAILVMEVALQYQDRYLAITKTVIIVLTILTFMVATWNTFVAYTAWML